MKLSRVFHLGTFLGIRFQLHYTWFFIFILVTVLLVYPDLLKWQYWLIGIVTSLLFFASVVAHELAHGLAGRANNIPIESITLFLFGGVAQMSREPMRPTAELKMALAGPLCSLEIAGIFGIIWLLLPYQAGPIATMILWLAIINGAMAVFNLIPGFPLDGGRILRSLLWYFTGNYFRSTRIAVRLGQGVGYLLMLGGILVPFLQPFGLSWFEGIWIVVIGWFVTNTASESYRQLLREERTPASAVYEATLTDSPVVPPDVQ